MTAKPALGAPRASRRAAVSATVTAPVASTPLDPGRIAFCGTAQLHQPDASTLDVQALCWPIMPTAWASLSQGWALMREERGERKPMTAAAAATLSWIRACAPQLGAPFRDTTAEESSIAATLARTPMEVAVVVLDSRGRQQTTRSRELSHLEAFSSCLALYSDAARARNRAPCALLLSRSSGASIDAQYEKEFANSRSMQSDAGTLDTMQLRFWSQPREPLPLELANVIAAAVLRHQLDPNGFNPVFDAVMGKLAHKNFPSANARGRKR